MPLGIRTKIFGAYVLVLALGMLLAALIFGYGESLRAAAGDLVRNDLPRLRQIAALRHDLLEQEASLYE